MALTIQQQAVVDFIVNDSRSLIVDAKAGTGKTFTLIQAVLALPSPANTAMVAYNRAIADEVKEKLRENDVHWKHCNANTVHSFGYGAYRRAFGNVEIDANKVDDILDKMHGWKGDINKELYEVRQSVLKLVSLAKQHLIGFKKPIESFETWSEIGDHFDIFEDLPGYVSPAQVIEWSQEALRRSNAIKDPIDFDDMIYLPLVFKCSFWNYDIVFVDEAQDTNAARRAIVSAMVKKNGRVIAVGDPNQAIYGFTGADSDALELIKKDFSAETLPLSVCFRCESNIIEVAKEWVPTIEAHKEGGEVNSSRFEEVDWTGASSNDVILCRNNGPLVSIAYGLLRRGIACYVEGRDIGVGLEKLARRWKLKTLNQLRVRLNEYAEREIQKALAKKKEQQAATIEDKVDTLLVFITKCQEEDKHTIDELVEEIHKIFGDTKPGEKPKCLTLSTIHKSKGREWTHVYWLDKEITLPSPWARQEWQVAQEYNLCYVAATRAEKELTFLSSPVIVKEEAPEREAA